MEIIKQALKAGQTTLSEYDSKKVLAEYKIPVTKEIVAKDINELNQAAEKIGFPLVLKGSSSEIAHKTEKGLIKIDIRTLEEATGAFEEIIAKMGGDKGGVLVQEMIKGQRELVIGLT
ncbi:MAG: carboxylate--amine ligase, partial [Deltaproteobacteria bacterium]|nr:carboxylate--amine ligase [Deltaproteobacteria bacterium]